MNILSLFDGMSCGQQALHRARVAYKNYYASEVDKYAIKVTMANYPNTIQLGDVRCINTSTLPKIDLLIGGSPCQSFSFAGKQNGLKTKDIEVLTLQHYLELKNANFEFDGQSYLFWEYIRILHELKPTYFFLENVEMGEKWEKIISKTINVNGIHLNSSLVSAQNRKRIYWTNIGMQSTGLFGYPESIIKPPKDKLLLLKDILQPVVNDKYLMSAKMIEGFKKHKIRHDDKGTGFGFNPKTEDNKGACLRANASICATDNMIIVNNERKIISYDMPEIVNVRKYDVDIASLKLCLKKHKKYSAAIIAENLNVSLTLVEHWFRNDKYFTIPDTEHWLKLKSLLNIETDIFDESINTFESREGIFDMRNRVYDEYGIAPTLTSTNQTDKVLTRQVIQLSNNNKSNNNIQPYQQDRVYDINGLAPSLQAQLSSGSSTINTEKIRRLTPIECERLQTIDDNYTNYVSDSQRYKMIGNGWTIDIIAHFFSYLH